MGTAAPSTAGPVTATHLQLALAAESATVKGVVASLALEAELVAGTAGTSGLGVACFFHPQPSPLRHGASAGSAPQPPFCSALEDPSGSSLRTLRSRMLGQTTLGGCG